MGGVVSSSESTNKHRVRVAVSCVQLKQLPPARMYATMEMRRRSPRGLYGVIEHPLYPVTKIAESTHGILKNGNHVFSQNNFDIL